MLRLEFALYFALSAQSKPKISDQFAVVVYIVYTIYLRFE